MNIDYERLDKEINDYGNYILTCIKNEYGSCMNQEQLDNIQNLLKDKFIIIERPSDADIEFFSKQAGITEPEKYDVSYVPSAHGGRTKEDNKIHIYPYTKSFENCKTNEELVQDIIDSIVVHEIFHYFIRPGLSLEDGSIKDRFGNFLTEGLVQLYSEKFAKEHRLGNPKSNYDINVSFAEGLLSSFPTELSQTQIDKIVFNKNQDELLEIANDGKKMYEEFSRYYTFHDNITDYIVDFGKYMGMDENAEEIKGFVKHFKKITDPIELYSELSVNISDACKDEEVKKHYIEKLNKIFENYGIEINDIETVQKMGAK